ncbi:hypothetical protein M1D96_06350 [Pseudomonas sp. D1-3]
MSQNKHTPGPWAVHHEPEWNHWSVRSANAADLAEAPIYFELAENIGGHVRGDDFSDRSEIEANAFLIAAAPDLLEALESIIASARAGNAAILDRLTTQAEDAIAKARGDQP